MISRENIARLIESQPLSGSISDLRESMQDVESAILSSISSLLKGGPLEEHRNEHSLARMRTALDTFKSAVDVGTKLFSGVEITSFEDARTKIFPRIVEYNVIQLLQVREPKDIPIVNSIFAQLCEKGVSAVWEKILPDVTTHTNNLLGLSFPREYIQEGETLPLDIQYLSSLVPTTSAPANITSSTTTAVVPKRDATYMGLRRGFLFASSSKSEEKMKKHDAESDNNFSMK